MNVRVFGPTLVGGAFLVVALVASSAPSWPGLPLWGQDASSGGGGFDRLNEADRAAFSARFEQEVWPLLERNGVNGCVGCHNPRQNRGDLKFSGKPDDDFRTLLRRGFLLPKDPGGFLHVVREKDPKKRMPPGNRAPWTEQEIDVLRQFVNDVDAKQAPQ